jgi:hypothetical protein
MKRTALKRKKRLRKKSLAPMRILWRKAWECFSLYIRTRDKECVTCGSTQNLQAGHFVHKSQTSSIYFEPTNVHAQCRQCNFFMSGNLGLYCQFIIRKYGQAHFDWLLEQRGKPRKWSRADLEQVLHEFTALRNEKDMR